MKGSIYWRFGLSGKWMFVIIVFLVLATGVSPAMGITVIPANRDVNLKVSNDAGALFEVYGDDTYNFFNTNQSATQGQNALHISNNNESYNYGQVTLTSDQAGTFFMTDTGGRGWSDDGILLLAVNGTVPDNFRVHIRSSGYQWTPVPTGSYPAYSDITYYPGAVDEYFTKEDFLYGPQIWRPAPGADNYYPIYDMQDMTDTSNTFSIMFIDLNAGILGSGTWSQWDYTNTQPVTDYGAVRIEYSFENLPTYAVFDAYAFTVSSNQGTGIRWLNRLSSTGASGYSVIGLAPTATFTSDIQAGPAPLTVVFTDLSTNTPTSWAWDFGDGDFTNATEQNPVHTFAAAGTYTVKLTVSNAAGSDEEEKVGYITVTPSILPLPGFTDPPTDPDGDGIYEDLNANGRKDFADVVLYFNQMTWIGTYEPVSAFDLNGNGRIDFADIVALFNEI